MNDMHVKISARLGEQTITITIHDEVDLPDPVEVRSSNGDICIFAGSPDPRIAAADQALTGLNAALNHRIPSSMLDTPKEGTPE